MAAAGRLRGRNRRRDRWIVCHLWSFGFSLTDRMPRNLFGMSKVIIAYFIQYTGVGGLETLGRLGERSDRRFPKISKFSRAPENDPRRSQKSDPVPEKILNSTPAVFEFHAHP